MEEKKIDKNSQEYWDSILAKEGLAPIEGVGKNPLGNGLGDVSPKVDKLEESNRGHGPMCPINLGHSINETKIDQPNENPVEDEILEKLEKEGY